MPRRNRIVVGVDLGGTNVFAAVVNTREGELLGQAKRLTEAEQGAEAVTARIAETVKNAIKRAGLKKKDILGVGIGVPGPVYPETGLVANCPNLGPSWNRFPLREALAALLGLPVVVDNDVNVGAVGEHTYGAGRGSRDMLAIFVGTGIGGGLIIDGKLHGGQRNAAGEVGHMVVLDGGPLCGCGGRGHAEALASRTAMERDIRAAIASGRTSIVPQLLDAAKRNIISAGVIGDAYDAGDEVTIEVVKRAQYYLGILISACVNLLDPEIIVVGGGVLERMGEAYLDPVRVAAQQHYINKLELDRIRIIRAALGDLSGAMGAAVLAAQRLG